MRLEQYAVLVFASPKQVRRIPGVQVMHASDFLGLVMRGLRDRKLASRAVPEHLPLIRTLQYVTEYRRTVLDVWAEEFSPDRAVTGRANSGS
ncbi:MAG: hypothetical protein FJX72_22315 [Armatimonadetes bacterium]|nr:hypothetical protein [Armatimonadota bacterium]